MLVKMDKNKIAKALVIIYNRIKHQEEERISPIIRQRFKELYENLENEVKLAFRIDNENWKKKG